MLWYFLYPLRGTTDTPKLAPNHPLRVAFSRYAKWAARHVQTVLPLSTAVIFVFLYLFPFLYTTDATNITSGVSNLPHHVWTDAQPLGETSTVEPDVIMRSIWVHGSYMKALERDVLLGALELQDELLGPTTNFNPRQPANRPDVFEEELTGDLTPRQRDAYHIINGLTNQSWFFHSPLQYWAGSTENIQNDEDILETVNAGKTQSTSVNVTLRHSIVFSGKRFEERRLVAADALVITLIHRRDSPVGRRWVKRAEELARERSDTWQIIPGDGLSTSDQLYEFQFRPLSLSDMALLTMAYSLSLSYLIWSLTKLRALKSRLGLMVSIIVQITASIVSSFTVCAIFKIDLSRVPSYAYPLIVLAISLENSLRLINAVIMTSSTISNSDRIGEAFGETAHIAIANRVQNLLILWVLSRITFPGVAAFCTFVAIATVFDFIYLSTFLLSVLSVDVRQKELVELEKAFLLRTKASEKEKQRSPWMEMLTHFRVGETAVSTRIAGTIVVICFVLIAQSHYVTEGSRQWLNQIFGWPWKKTVRSVPKPSLLIDIHQARSPTSWLRLQDHETAREVINVVKPWAHSYVARVYDPIIFVLKGSDRVPHSREPIFLPAVYDFIHHEIPGFVVLLMMVVAAVLLGTKYLLRDEYENFGGSEHPDDEPLLSVKSLTQGHTLDVLMMTASPAGQVVSVGLDRVIQVWDVPIGGGHRVASDAEVPLENPFPVLSMAIDYGSKWLAFVSWRGVFLWNLVDEQWAGTRKVDLGGYRPETVFFCHKTAYATPTLVLVKRNGMGLEMELEVDESRDFNICKTPLVSAVSFPDKSHTSNGQQPPIAILTASRKSCVHLVRQRENEWVSTELDFGEREAKDVHCLLPIPALSAYLIGRSKSVDLVDLESSTILHTFPTETMQLRTLKHIPLLRAHQPNLTSLTLAYISSETEDLVVQTYLPEKEDDNLMSYCPSDPRSGQRRLGKLMERKHRIDSPGVWEALTSGSILGVRQKKIRTRPRSLSNPSSLTNGLRRRGANSQQASGQHPPETTEPPKWEAWVMNHPESTGEFETRLLDDQHLMISKVGPLVKLGSTSVAVGLGNVVKVISVGHEHFDGLFSDGFGFGFGGMGGGEGKPNLASRRKKSSLRASTANAALRPIA
ncbi:putative sterol regulatory element-binding protein [Triangularia verruculosa]|uniref:Sterol regulatory element-binding protein cleavage-activating protein n=1 Tax=Triangularia verruculosa TaxID=2587418 RepID=A0AAN7AYN0_9PEZI|nr:putative sterol regulatory element-binding protein [Triangularia verruculosa]